MQPLYEDDEVTIPGVYIGDLNKAESLQLVPVAAVPQLEAADLIDENEYLSSDEEEILIIEEKTNPRFSISAVSGVVPISEVRQSIPANELYRRIWCCPEEE